MKQDWRFYTKYIGLGLITASGVYYATHYYVNSFYYYLGILMAGGSIVLLFYFLKKDKFIKQRLVKKSRW